MLANLHASPYVHTHLMTFPANDQRAGQTTALGDPRPFSWREGGGSKGGDSSGGSGGAGGGDSYSQQGYVDPRAEAPLEDKTGKYAAIGAAMGVFLGWASQFV